MRQGNGILENCLRVRSITIRQLYRTSVGTFQQIAYRLSHQLCQRSRSALLRVMFQLGSTLTPANMQHPHSKSFVRGVCSRAVLLLVNV